MTLQNYSSKVCVAVQKYSQLNGVAEVEEHRSLPGEDGWKPAVHSLLEVADHNLVAALAHSLAEAVHNPVGEVGIRNLAEELVDRNPAAAEGGIAADRSYLGHYIDRLEELRIGLVAVRCGHLLGAENLFHPWYHKMNRLHPGAS